VEAKVLHRQLAALTKLSTPGAIRFIQSNGRKPIINLDILQHAAAWCIDFICFYQNV
jgi:hypothetical protein